jgi:hypothetical protein
MSYFALSFQFLPQKLFPTMKPSYLTSVPSPSPPSSMPFSFFTFPLCPLPCIGAGCGLTSLVLSLCGYSVIATDKPDILPLLRKNITESIAGQICVKSFDWKDSNSNEIVSNVFDRSPDLILLSDCFYRSDAVPQLWKLILKVTNSLFSVLLFYLLTMPMSTADLYPANHSCDR